MADIGTFDRLGPHPTDTFSADLGCKQWPESIPPEPYGFVADVDAALMQQVLDVSERKWKANVHHDRQANDLRAAVKVLEGVRFAHAGTLRGHPARLNQYPSDNALRHSEAKEENGRTSLPPGE
jgi:hypothetical protein